MDRMLYVAMSGANQTALAQEINTNNLANANTDGFLADLTAFKAMYVNGAGYASRAYTMAEVPSSDFTPGMVVSTGRQLDIAVEGSGFFAVQAKDGAEAYTRAGNLRMEPSGLLVTGSGLPVLGNGGPITIPPVQKLDIGIDGTISIVPLGQESSATIILDRIKLVKTESSNLVKGNDGLVRTRDGAELESDASLRVVSGALEASNVNPISSLVEMISLSRRYESQIKLMKTAEEMDSATDKLVQI